jgi:hypothetical protein
MGKERQQTRRKDKQQEQVHKRIWGKEQVLFCIRIFQTEEAERFCQVLQTVAEKVEQSCPVC